MVQRTLRRNAAPQPRTRLARRKTGYHLVVCRRNRNGCRALQHPKPTADYRRWHRIAPETDPKREQFHFILSHLPRQYRFLTRLDPVSMVRAASGRRNYRGRAERLRVSKAWPTTHAVKVTANHRRSTRLRSPPGFGISANGSAISIPAVHPKAARVNVRPWIRRRSPA